MKRVAMLLAVLLGAGVYVSSAVGAPPAPDQGPKRERGERAKRGERPERGERRDREQRRFEHRPGRDEYHDPLAQKEPKDFNDSLDHDNF